MEKRKLTFTIDFDNTCALEFFPEVGPDVPFASDVLKTIQKSGHEIILWTCRQDESLEKAIKWFSDHNIHLDGINDWSESHKQSELAKNFGLPRKVLGDFNIDDKNFGCPIKEIIDVITGDVYRCVDWEKILEVLYDKGILEEE